MKRPPSIRSSLLIRSGIGVGLLLFALSTAIYLLVRHGMEKEMDKSILQTAALLSNQVELEDGHINFEWQEGLGTNRALIDEGLFQFWDETTGITSRSPGLQSRDLPKFCGEGGVPQVKDILLPGNQHAARAVGLRIYPFVLPSEVERMVAEGKLLDAKSFPHVLVVARDVKPIRRTLSRLRWILGTGSVLTLVLVFVLIHRQVRVSLRPIDDLTVQVQERSGLNLDSALDLPELLPCELTGLAEGFDSLLAKVAATRQRERDFVRHAAHELRTPIAGLLATTDLALSKNRGAAEHVRFLSECRQAAMDLGELVKRLSALARVGGSIEPAMLESVDLSAIAEESLGRFRQVFDQKGLSCVVEGVTAPAWVTADKALCRVVVNNLLDNAACYARTGSMVRVAQTSDTSKARFAVENEAEIVPEEIDRWFEPLFRKNTSRHDAGAHLGIGLTLSRDAAIAMGGSLIVRKSAPQRIEFVLELPLASA